MEPSDIKQTKHGILILYILLGGVILFLVNRIPAREQLYSFYTDYETNQSIESYIGETRLPKDMQEQLNEISSYQFFQEHKYPEAINAIT